MNEQGSEVTVKGRRRFGRLFRFLILSALAATALGTVVRYTIGDLLIPTAVIFYATPWFLRLVAMLFCIPFLHGRRRIVAVVLLVLAASDGVASFRPGGGGGKGGAFTVSTWNAGRELDQWEEQWHFSSDIVMIIESGTFDAEEWARFTAATPGYRWLRIDRGTLLGVLGTIGEAEDLSEPGSFRCHRIPVVLPGRGEIQVVSVDIHSQPWLPKERAIEKIFNAADAGVPAIVLGDFNMPPGSRWIGRATAGRWSLANRAQQEGFIETWPYFLPVHCLDQIWLAGGLEALSARQEGRSSDHRLVEVAVGMSGR